MAFMLLGIFLRLARDDRNTGKREGVRKMSGGKNKDEEVVPRRTDSSSSECQQERNGVHSNRVKEDNDLLIYYRSLPAKKSSSGKNSVSTTLSPNWRP
jgi:hypothetical protein